MGTYIYTLRRPLRQIHVLDTVKTVARLCFMSRAPGIDGSSFVSRGLGTAEYNWPSGGTFPDFVVEDDTYNPGATVMAWRYRTPVWYDSGRHPGYYVGKLEFFNHRQLCLQPQPMVQCYLAHLTISSIFWLPQVHTHSYLNLFRRQSMVPVSHNPLLPLLVVSLLPNGVVCRPVDSTALYDLTQTCNSVRVHVLYHMPSAWKTTAVSGLLDSIFSMDYRPETDSLILADALDDAGCTETLLLASLRLPGHSLLTSVVGEWLHGSLLHPDLVPEKWPGTSDFH